MRKFTFLLLSSVFLSMTVFAGGYQVRLQGNKQNGFGLVGTPLSVGSSAMFYNPGALGFMESKIDFEFGGSAILSTAAFQKAGSNYQAETDNPLGTPFYFYFAGKLGKLITLGLGVYTPYGNSAKWESDWAGKNLIQDISLTAIYVQPTIAFNFNEKFGVGLGFVYTIGGVELNKGLNYSGDAGVNLKGDATSFGYNVGIFFRPVENWSIGLNYRSEIIMSVEGGDATFTVPSSLQGVIPTNNKFNAELPLPANLDLGVAVQITEKFMLAVEFDWVFWSVYDTLSFTFEEAGDLLDSKNPRKYSNTFIPRLGMEYAFSEKFQIRGGAYYDTSPANDRYFTPETVTLNTFAYTLGLSWYPNEHFGLDLSFLQTFGLKSDKTYQPDNFGGTYQTSAIIPGLGLSFKF
ncbi:MAG: outer membrane protein transport protein [Bacteroidales bacterium]|nr:outer membrane protein transport protein [Bacteroidales bacterium]MCF6341286.1 outer membrane protein transport protein [Bacteroidales bacterium]